MGARGCLPLSTHWLVEPEAAEGADLRFAPARTSRRPRATARPTRNGASAWPATRCERSTRSAAPGKRSEFSKLAGVRSRKGRPLQRLVRRRDQTSVDMLHSIARLLKTCMGPLGSASDQTSENLASV